MGRSSKWPDQEEMWALCARWRSGGVNFSDMAGRLAAPEYRERFGLEETPSADVIRYQLNRRNPAAKRPAVSAVLPPDEHEAHMRGLIHFGLLLRARAWVPGLGGRPAYGDIEKLRGHRPWAGFVTAFDHRLTLPEANLAEELEVERTWPGRSGDPREHPLYPYLVAHLQSTGQGAEMLAALERLYETSPVYLQRLDAFLKRAQALARTEADLRAPRPGTEKYRGMRVGQLVARLHPRDEAEERSDRQSLPGSDHGDARTEKAKAELRDARRHLDVAWRETAEAIKRLQAALTPTDILRRRVREGKCEICR